MKTAGFAITMGLGAAVGAVAVMMLPKQCTARRFVDKAANKIEDAASEVGEKIADAIEM